MDKRIFLGRFVFKKSLSKNWHRSKWRVLIPRLLLGLRAPKAHFVIHCFGLMFQWDSPRSEQEVIKRMPEKYHFLLEGK